MDWHMKRFHQVCISTVLALALGTLAQAATYKWVDKDGHVHYSQQPPADANYERLNIRTQQPSSSSAPAPTQSAPAASGTTDNRGSAVIKEEVAKGEEQRQKNCEQAKKSLELYTVYRRVRDKDGNVVYLDDNERAKRIADSKAAIKEFCQ
jgi:hypothetical protein